MLRDALDWIKEHAAVRRFEAYGGVYVNGKNGVERINRPKPSPLHVATLKSLVDYVKDGGEANKETVFVGIVAPNQVAVIDSLNPDMLRSHFLEASPILPVLPIGSWVDREDMQIALQSCFVQTDECRQLIEFVSRLKAGAETEVKDDGITQNVTVSAGVKRVGNASVPNPVNLAPFRTFPELAQPVSPFVFRVRAEHGFQCKLIESDGGAWRLKAHQLVREYLEKELAGTQVKILS